MDGYIIGVFILLALTLVAAVGAPFFLFRRLLHKQKAETSQMSSLLDRHLGAAVKLLEVRDYYEETSRALKKMLDEAYKEGNRFRQDEIRKLIERLEAMKIRALDKQVRILDATGTPAPRKRRRRPRKRKDTPPGNPSNPNGRKPSDKPK